MKITKKFIEISGVSTKKQRTDSFFIHGWLQILTRYGLFKETIRKFLLALRKQKPGLYENIKGHLSKAYLEKDFDLTEKDHEKAKRRILSMAKDMHKLIVSFENHKQVKNYETFKILQQVFKEQCEIKNDSENKSNQIIIKDKPDKKAINSPHNKQVQYRRKGKQEARGDLGFVTETSDPSNKVQFITDAKVTQITKHDSKEQPQIQKRLKENDLLPEKQYADSGFVNGKTIKESKKNDVELEGPTAGTSQSFEEYESKSRPLDAGDFDTTYNSESGELVVNKCPNNQEPIKQYKSKKTGKLNVYFNRKICNACSLKGRCSVQIGKRVSTYSVSEEEYIGAIRHHKYMNDRQYRKECSVRAGAEALVSELVRAHGMRKSRHRERKRTELQLIFASLACNVKRFIKYWENSVHFEPELA